jgi:hypothetical protein
MLAQLMQSSGCAIFQIVSLMAMAPQYTMPPAIAAIIHPDAKVE